MLTGHFQHLWRFRRFNLLHLYACFLTIINFTGIKKSKMREIYRHINAGNAFSFLFITRFINGYAVRVFVVIVIHGGQ